MSAVKVEGNKALCVSNKMCNDLLPLVFGTDSDSKVEIKDPSTATVNQLVETALSCPVGAITVTDVETGKDLLV